MRRCIGDRTFDQTDLGLSRADQAGRVLTNVRSQAE